MRIRLTDQEHTWVTRKWSLIRRSQTAADAASLEWSEINDAINRKFEEDEQVRLETGRPPMTDLQKADAKSASLPLRDAFDTHKWHIAEAQRHIADVELFLRLRELEIL